MSAFNLRHQLDEARERRRLAAGFPADTTEPDPPAAAEPEPVTPEQSEFDRLIIDLRDPSSVLTWSAPPPDATDEPAEPFVMPLPSRLHPAEALPIWQGPRPTADADA